VPAFAKNSAVKHGFLWWNHIGNRAVRVGDWKLVADGKSPWELYDLTKDRSETKNLAAANPEKVKELERAWLKGAQECLALAKQDPEPVSKKKRKSKGGSNQQD
jgi:arylsulfatase